MYAFVLFLQYASTGSIGKSAFPGITLQPMQLLAGAKVIDINLDVKEDQVLFMDTQKFMGLLVTMAMAVAYVLSGTYGDVSAIGWGNAILIVAHVRLGTAHAGRGPSEGVWTGVLY